MIISTVDLIIDERKFTQERPFSIPQPIELRYASQPPRKQLITMRLEDGYETDFYLALPWVHYEWANVPNVSKEYPWLINGMYFSPAPLTDTLQVSLPCLPNFYGSVPCTEAPMAYETFNDPNFITSFWGEIFNYDGDLFGDMKPTHPVWTNMMKTADIENTNKLLIYETAEQVFEYWETLSVEEVLALNWPQKLTIPDCARSF